MLEIIYNLLDITELENTCSNHTLGNDEIIELEDVKLCIGNIRLWIDEINLIFGFGFVQPENYSVEAYQLTDISAKIISDEVTKLVLEPPSLTSKNINKYILEYNNPSEQENINLKCRILCDIL